MLTHSSHDKLEEVHNSVIIPKANVVESGEFREQRLVNGFNVGFAAFPQELVKKLKSQQANRGG